MHTYGHYKVIFAGLKIWWNFLSENFLKNLWTAVYQSWTLLEVEKKNKEGVIFRKNMGKLQWVLSHYSKSNVWENAVYYL